MAIKKRSATVVPGASGAAAAVKNPQASKTSFWGELPQHVMSGISRMVPTLIMGVVDSICQCNTPFNYLFRCFELQCLSRSVV